MTKPEKSLLWPAKSQISLGIRPVWSGSSLSPWRNLGSLATQWAHSEDWSDWADAHNIYFYGELTTIILQLSSNTLLICSADYLYRAQGRLIRRHRLWVHMSVCRFAVPHLKRQLKPQSHIGCDWDATCSRPISLQLAGDRWDRNARVWNEFMITN